MKTGPRPLLPVNRSRNVAIDAYMDVGGRKFRELVFENTEFTEIRKVYDFLSLSVCSVISVASLFQVSSKMYDITRFFSGSVNAYPLCR
jgi:hypothetical protein